MEMRIALLIAAAYLLGSIPFGLIVGKSKGIDPRKSGSGNIGATNVGRLLGKKFFFFVFTLDLLKGLIPMLIAGRLLQAQPREESAYVLWLLVGFAAILGHMFSVFLKFQGGKGVATSCGVLLGIYPFYTYAGLIALGIFIITFKITRYVSLGSILAAAAFPIAYVLVGLVNEWPVFQQQLPLLLFGILIATLIILKHKSNIARLLAGTESKFTRKPAEE